MTKTLFTFLGRVPNHEAGYRTTRYDFGDGSQSRPVAFFGWLLHERILPDYLVILGTAMRQLFDVLFKELLIA